VSGSDDETLRIWDASTGESVQVLEGHTLPVTSVAWDPTGTRIVSGSEDETLRLWDASTGESVQVLEGHTGSVESVAWDPTGTRIVSGSSDGTLRLWDASTGESVQVLEGHTDSVMSVAWDPTGTRIVSGSYDGTLRLWDASTGESVQVLEGHTPMVTSVAWDPTGTRIVSGSFDNTLRIWESRIEDALPMWRAAERRRRVRGWVDSLFEPEGLLEPVLAAIESDRERSEELRETAARMARARGNPSAEDLNDRAWLLVDPDRLEPATEDEVALALRLTRAAIQLKPDDPALQDTHAWALFANGLYDEALLASRRALELSDEDQKSDFQGYLNRLQGAVPQEQANDD
jgi:predicted NACHT family NTPase